MPLFISTFKGTAARRKRAARGLAAFAGVFLACVAWGLWLSARCPQWVYHDPAGREAWKYRATTFFETLEHPYADYALYHGIGPAISYARRADVLILGSSVSLDAFTDEQVRSAARKSGLTFFNLSLPGANYLFDEKMMARQHLAPRLVLLSDFYFFNAGIRAQEREAMALPYWRVWLATQEHSLYWLLQYILQGAVPRLLFFKAPPGGTAYLLRSVENGCRFEDSTVEKGAKVGFQPQGSKVTPEELEGAREFKQRMEQQGTRIILVHIPSPISPEHTKKMAKALQLPCILPGPVPMVTFDGLHLSAASSENFSKDFFQKLFKIPEFQELVREKNKKP